MLTLASFLDQKKIRYQPGAPSDVSVSIRISSFGSSRASYITLDNCLIKKKKTSHVRDSGSLRAYARPQEGETNSVADKDVYDSRRIELIAGLWKNQRGRKLNTSWVT